MAYLATERSLQRRQNPARILPGVRSVLSLAMPYPNPRHLASRPGYGRLAAYAWNLDYHLVIPDRLQALVYWIETQTGRPAVYKAYTDTGPILERDLAQRAGLGWIGKNTCLIHPRFGSYFLLAEVFLMDDLELDTPVERDYCGSCRRCIDACPTACILPDRTLDANRCISYLTIENKGAIPLDLRPRLGDLVFGCDICQQVCPWNLRFASLAPDPSLAFNPTLAQPELRGELRLSPQEFNRKFRRSPVQRARRRGYLRNIAVALGNLKDASTLPDLAQALRADPEPLVRGHAAWAVGQIVTPAARETLASARKTETDASVLSEIQKALEG